MSLITNLEDFKKLGKKNPREQHQWSIKRNKLLLRFWRCSCGLRLPIKGFIWKARYRDFLLKNRFNFDEVNSGYYCDGCADYREMGLEY